MKRWGRVEDDLGEGEVVLVVVVVVVVEVELVLVVVKWMVEGAVLDDERGEFLGSSRPVEEWGRNRGATALVVVLAVAMAGFGGGCGGGVTSVAGISGQLFWRWSKSRPSNSVQNAWE